VDADDTEIVQDLGPGLDGFLAHSGIVLPPQMTGEIFMRELLEGGPGISADQAFFARLAVSLLHPGLQHESNLTEIAELIKARLAKRGLATSEG
jgi:hypothetical protein